MLQMRTSKLRTSCGFFPSDFVTLGELPARLMDANVPKDRALLYVNMRRRMTTRSPS